jgi:hypothetical protein
VGERSAVLGLGFWGFVFAVRVPCPADLERGGQGGGRPVAEAVRRRRR